MKWSIWLYIFGIVGCKYAYGQGQRVAPGVPPQHYQQQPMHQQVPQHQQQMHQQVPQHQQQMHQQYQQQQQQVPMQPMQQQVPVQHIPQQHMNQGGHQPHHHEQHPQQILNAANIAHERDHIAEHFDVPIDTSKMSDEELQFHYFKMHDADNNNKLDGCELIKSLLHWHLEQGNKDKNIPQVGDKIFVDDELSNLIDPILAMDDSNMDGYIDYPEFKKAQQKAAATGRT